MGLYSCACHLRMNRAKALFEIPSERNEARQSSRSVTSWPFLLPSDWMQTDRCHVERPEDTNPTANTQYWAHHPKIMTITGGGEKNTDEDWKRSGRQKTNQPAYITLLMCAFSCMSVLLGTKRSHKDTLFISPAPLSYCCQVCQSFHCRTLH